MIDSCMKLYIKNIAKIREAEIAVDGITVIAGANNTGKSTIGKVLFGMFQTIHDKADRILEAKKAFVKDGLSRLFHPIPRGNKDSSFLDYIADWQYNKRSLLTQKIVEEYQGRDYQITVDEVKACIHEFVQENPNYQLWLIDSEKERSRIIEQIQKFLNVDDDNILSELVHNKFNSIFNGQVNSLDALREEAWVKLFVKDTQTTANFKNHACRSVSSPITLYNKVIYIDNPLILNKLTAVNNLYYRSRTLRAQSITPMEDYMLQLLENSKDDDSVGGAIENVLHKERLVDVFKLIDSATDSTVFASDEGYLLMEKGARFGVYFANLSLGLRTFVILKMLLEKDLIRDKDVIVLDEPEIHLHPQWQVLFSHLIVLIQKEFNLSVVITTHSHFFVDAINLYTRKYKTDSTTHYYLASLEGRRAIVSDTTDNLNAIYEAMSVAVDELEDLRHELEEAKQ